MNSNPNPNPKSVIHAKYRYRRHQCHESGKKNVSTLYRTALRCMHCGRSNFNKTADCKMECFYCGLAISIEHDIYIKIKPHDYVSYGTPEQYDEFVNVVVPVLMAK